MSVLNNLSKIAKSVVEIPKLNASISVEKDKIKFLYMEIGEEVYGKYKQGESIIDDMIGKCEEIEQISENLDYIKDRILEIKNIKLCTACGSKVEYSVLFCPMCGVKQPILKDDSTKQKTIEEDEYLFKENGANCEGTECTFDEKNKENL